MTWSYDLNRDIYNICKEAIEPNQKGYMKRIKELSDKTHSKYNHLTEKHLREQALWVINKKLIKERGLITNEAEQTIRADNEENIDQPVENNEDNIEQNGSQDVSADSRSRVPPTSTDNESLIDLESESYKELKQKWDRNLEKYKKLQLDQREYEMRVNRPINRDNLKNINFILGQHLEQNVKEDGISL